MTNIMNGVPQIAFPAPLVLPGDDLACDPTYPGQSALKWLKEPARNQVTRRKNTIYVAAPPVCEPALAYVNEWAQAISQRSARDAGKPAIEDVVDYIAAFYHGIKVQQLPRSTLRFQHWDPGMDSPLGDLQSRISGPQPGFIGLATTTECIRVRVRPSIDGTFPQQLNLNDLLDVAISCLPQDAYALLMLVDHDIFEDEDDDFACGRAYGGSRVAVVSTARYDPRLDGRSGVERLHAWPASHCKAYVSSHTEQSTKGVSKRVKRACTSPSVSRSGEYESTALRAAVAAHHLQQTLLNEDTPDACILTGLWLGRVCRTASHELGHCFGIDHCVYYACVMQGTTSLAEDARQPPYLCPVDLQKILYATKADATQRYGKLLEFCARQSRADVDLFRSFAAWLQVLLENLQSAENNARGEGSV